MTSLIATGATVITIIALMFVGVPTALILAGMWRIFKKAGKPGWGALIPLYNSFQLFEIVWGNGWLFLLLLLPGGNIIAVAATMIKLARVFGKGVWLGVLTVLLPVIYVPVIGFGSSEYTEPDDSGLKGIVISSILVCVLSIGLSLFAIASGVYLSTLRTPSEGTVQHTKIADNIQGEIVRKSDVPEEERLEVKDDYSSYYADLSSENFDMVTLNNSSSEITVPVLKQEEYWVEDSFAVSNLNGINSTISYSTRKIESTEDLTARLKELVDTAVDTYSSDEYCSDVTVSEVYSGEGYVYQRIDYTTNFGGDEDYHDFRILKVDNANGYACELDLKADTWQISTMNADSLLEETLNVYNIEF